MEKKDLKKYIRENGFFLHLEAIEELKKEEFDEEKISTDAVRTSAKLPADRSNISVFKGRLSQEYKKGEKNRNGYKYDLTGVDLNAYKNKPIVLLQHKMELPVGMAVAFENIVGDGLWVTYFIDFATKAASEYEHEIKNGYIGMLSTGAITNEWQIEDNKTGERMTPADARTAGIDVYSVLLGESTTHTMVVTDWTLVEASVVTIGSNEKALTAQESIGAFAKNIAEKMKEEEIEEKKEEEPEAEEPIAEAPKEEEKTGEEEPEEPETPPEEVKEEEKTIVPEPTQEAKTDTIETIVAQALQAEIRKNESEKADLQQWAKDIFSAMFSLIETQGRELNELRHKVESVPSHRQPLVFRDDSKPAQKSNLIEALKAQIF
jgi:hypothetical protein